MAKQRSDKSDDSSLFMPVVSKATLAINKSAAGAGVLGLVGFAALLVAAGFAVRRSISYHATYTERMNAQERDLKKGPVDGEKTR